MSNSKNAILKGLILMLLAACPSMGLANQKSDIQETMAKNEAASELLAASYKSGVWYGRPYYYRPHYYYHPYYYRYYHYSPYRYYYYYGW